MRKTAVRSCLIKSRKVDQNQVSLITKKAQRYYIAGLFTYYQTKFLLTDITHNATLRLTHIQFTQLQPMTWCATAHVREISYFRHQDWYKSLRQPTGNASYINSTYINTDTWDKCSWQYHLPSANLSVGDIARTQRQRQRQGVRLLLQQLLDHLALSDTLDESNFPYRLAKARYYVCFSHTGNKSNSKLNENTNQTINVPLSSTVAW